MLFLKSLLFVLLSAFVTSCGQVHFKGKKVPHVVVSIPPYLSLVKEIAEDSVTIASAIEPSFDPHTSEITPLQIKKIQHANLFIGIGEVYEKKLLKSIEEGKEPLVLQLNEILPLLSYSEKPPSAPYCQEPHAFSPDPHFYLSPKLLVFQIKSLIEGLSTLNPQRALDYAKKGEKLIQKVEGLDKTLKEKLSPYKERGVVISHAALGYFCHDYALIQIATECEGKSPLPKSVSTMYQLAKESNAICAFTLPQFNNKGVEMIAQELNLRIESFNPLAENVLETIEQIGNSLAKCP